MPCIPEKAVRKEVLEIFEDSLDQSAKDAFAELDRLLADEKRQPITYNHYYTDTIQSTRYQQQRDAVETAIQSSILEDWHGKLHE